MVLGGRGGGTGMTFFFGLGRTEAVGGFENELMAKGGGGGGGGGWEGGETDGLSGFNSITSWKKFLKK